MTVSSEQDAMRKGWCPGALRPMQTGDGFLVRIKPSANRVSCHAARKIAALSSQYGNGLIDLSQRANLQLRGVSEQTLPDLTTALDQLDLLDEDAARESIRNILVSPAANIDPQAADVSDIISGLETALATETRVHDLPGKFCFSIDAGGAVPLGDTTSDITLTASSENTMCSIKLAGATDVSVSVDRNSAVQALIMLADVFLAHHKKDPSLRRMRNLVSRDGADVVFIQSRLTSIQRGQQNKPATHTPVIGKKELAQNVHIAAIGLPFGRMTTKQLTEITSTAETANAKELHLTPWRSIFIPCATSEDATKILNIAHEIGLITTHNDPRLYIDACSGAPACKSGETNAMADAKELSENLALPDQISECGLIHVSGCLKSCARRGPSHVTLIGRDGTYDLIVDGTAQNKPHQANIHPDDLTAAVQQVLSNPASVKMNTKGAA